LGKTTTKPNQSAGLRGWSLEMMTLWNVLDRKGHCGGVTIALDIVDDQGKALLIREIGAVGTRRDKL